MLVTCDGSAAGTVTKLDWLAWTAAVGNSAQRRRLLQWVFALAKSRGAAGGRVPMSDFYDVTTVRLHASRGVTLIARVFDRLFGRDSAGGYLTVRGRGLLSAQCMR